jgi:hypothetical protein
MPTTLPDDFETSERGNTWMTDGGGNHVGWFALPGGGRLEVAVTPGNSPGFTVRRTDGSDADLAEHARGLLAQGWTFRKCNIPGIDPPAPTPAGDPA